MTEPSPRWRPTAPTTAWSRSSSSTRRPDLVPGRIARVDRDRSVVATAEGMVTATSDELPVVGDWVALRPARGRGDARDRARSCPRWSELSKRGSGPMPRPAGRGRERRRRVHRGRPRPRAEPEPHRARARGRVGERRAVRSSCSTRPTPPTTPRREGEAVRDRIGLVDVVVDERAHGCGDRRAGRRAPPGARPACCSARRASGSRRS